MDVRGNESILSFGSDLTKGGFGSGGAACDVRAVSLILGVEEIMKRLLRRTPAGVSVSYSDKDFSNNLTGTDFEYEETNGSVCLGIDLTGNLRVRNRNANCYDDVCDLVKKHAKLKSVQLDQAIAKRLVPVCRRFPNAIWKLELIVGGKGIFKYSVEMRPVGGTIFIDVRSEV